jgi:hypothetical protein
MRVVNKRYFRLWHNHGRRLNMHIITSHVLCGFHISSNGLIPSVLSPSLIFLGSLEKSAETRQVGESVQDPFEKIMAPWMLDVKFPCGTQFTFASLTFTAGEDGNVRMLSPGPALECLVPVYGQALSFPTISSITGSSYSGSDPYAGQHIRTFKLV